MGTSGGHRRKIYGIAAWPARHGILGPLGGAGGERRQPASRALQHSKPAPRPPCLKVRFDLATDGDQVLCLLPTWQDITEKILCHSAHPNLPDVVLHPAEPEALKSRDPGHPGSAYDNCHTEKLYSWPKKNNALRVDTRKSSTLYACLGIAVMCTNALFIFTGIDTIYPEARPRKSQ